jgi:predicted kinase
MGTGTFVQFAGTSCGAGKSTLSRALAAWLGPRAEFVEEDALFRLPELEGLADHFRRKDYPSAGVLLASFADFLAARPAVDWIVNDGSWVLLAEDLPWAQASWEALVDYARRLRSAVFDAGLEPLVFFLDAPPEVAVARARRRDGDESFDRWIGIMRRQAPLVGVSGGTEVELVAGWCERVRRVWHEAGWSLVDLPAGEPAEVVLEAALAHLGLRSAHGER